MENSMEFPQKIETRTTIWSRNSTSGYLSEDKKDTSLERCMHPMFTTALFTKASNLSVHQQMDEWVKKMWPPPLDYHSDRKKEVLPFVTTGMDPEGIMLSEVSQTRKDNTTQFHLHVESKKTKQLSSQR